MLIGKITGKVISTIKDEKIRGARLYVVQPLDQNKNPDGKPIIAVDTINSGQEDLVYLVKSREASLAWEIKGAPIDAAIVGIIDKMEVAQ